jgi:hypothetical protein
MCRAILEPLLDCPAMILLDPPRQYARNVTSETIKIQVRDGSVRMTSPAAYGGCRMSLGQSQASPELIPEEGSPPGSDIA